ncbi:MAG: sigma-70 family RNA polymerase sigma factor [Planctomycetota bacterium]
MAAGVAPEELFLQSRWVLTLARRLVGAGDAGDLAQEAMLAALRRPPRGDGPLRPWLARVTRNLAWKRRRGERRRQVHETGAAATRASALPAAGELAAAGELLQRVVAEVGHLDEPLRAIVTLRYLQELDATEIGRRLGMPAGTVRWRLAQGMEQLRRRLDAQHDGERARWSAPLAAVLGVRAMPVTPPWSLLRTAAWPLAAVSLTVGAALSVARIGTAPTPPERTTLAAGPSAPPAAADGVAPPASPRTAADPATAAVAKPTAANAPVPPDAVAFAARVLDRDGRPLHAVLQWRPGSDHLGLTDADGHVRLVLRPPTQGTPVPLQLSANGHATRRLAATGVRGEWTHLGDLVLPPARSAQGRVLGPDGTPVVGARVFATPAAIGHAAAPVDPERGPPGWPEFAVDAAATAADGAFRIHGLPALDVRLWAVADDRVFAGSAPLRLGEPGPQPPVTMCCAPLPPGSAAQVEVVDPSGSPVAAARVRRRSTGVIADQQDPGQILRPRWFAADSGGDVVLPLRVGLDYELRIEAPGYAVSTIGNVRAGDRVRAALEPR